MRSKSDWYLCPVCGKPRGRGSDHSKCSKLLQAKHKAEQKPITWKGKEGDRVITQEQQRISRGRTTQRRYLSGKFKPPE